MRPNWLAAALLGAMLLSAPAIETPRAQGSASAAVMARVIVKYKADTAFMKAQTATTGDRKPAQMRSLAGRVGVDLVAGAEVGERSHVVFATGIDSAALAAKLAADSDVEYAVPDGRKHALSVPADPFYTSRPYDSGSAPASGGPLSGQWYLKPPAATGMAGSAVSSVNAEQAWDITTGAAGVVVAVLDTGVRFDHPDLKRVSAGGNLLDGYDFISADSANVFLTANDGDGRDADASDPGDFVTAAEKAGVATFKDCDVADSSWHGTQTLSLIGAQTNNGIGMASVGRNVTVLPVRVIGKCGGFDSDIVAAMRWAAGRPVSGVPANAHPARVINMSLGGVGACGPVYQDAVTEVVAAGAVVVVSAGNDDTAVSSPANCAGVIAVAGLRTDGDKGGISSLGAEIAIAAPSANCPTGSPCTYPILAAYNAGKTTPAAEPPEGSYTGSFVVFLGTSFSAPLVSGAAALMLSVQPSLTPADIKARLQSSARPFPTSGSSITPDPPLCVEPTSTAQVNCYCTTTTCGAGMLDVHAAVLAAAGAAASTPPVTTPSGDSGGGGGGGGALGVGWLLLLLVAVLALAATPRCARSLGAARTGRG